MGTYCRVGRCKKIEERNGKTFYTIKFPNGAEHEYGDTYVINETISGALKVINLKLEADRTLSLRHDTDVISDYKYFHEGNKSEKSHRAFEKSKFLETCPLDENGLITKRIFKDITITDESHDLVGDIRARRIMFIGAEPLKVVGNGAAHIRCAKAIIMNPCVVSYILPRKLGNAINIESSHIEVKHEFIDINAVYEVLSLLDYGYCTLEHDISVLKFDFKYAGVDFNDIKNIVVNEVYTRLDDECNGVSEILRVISAMHWACIMYMSTNYEIDYLLELAEMCYLKITKDLNMTMDEKPYNNVSRLFQKLRSGVKL